MLALSMLCAFIPITSSAYSGTQYGDYLYYEINDDNTAVTITDCDERTTEIDIPSKINGLPVTSIGYSAFRNCSSLTIITIPDSVTKIDRYAFAYCSSLASITIPDGVTYIGYYAFDGCSSLTSITIPDSVTEIGWDAFSGCSNLKDVYFTGTENKWSAIDIYKGNDALKNATIHYNSTAPTPTPTPTPVPTTTAKVTKSETDTAYTFEVNAENKYEDCYVYAAVYDENGALIEINPVPLSTAENTSISVDKNDNGKTIKIFLWTDTMQSIIEKAKEFEV